MVLLQRSDRLLLQPLVNSAIPDGLYVASKLKIEFGQSRHERLPQRLKFGRIGPGRTRMSVRSLTFRAGRHVFPQLVIGCWRSLVETPVQAAAVFHTTGPLN
jgi:hypothetical protein